MNHGKSAIIYVTSDIERALGTMPGKFSIGGGEGELYIAEYFVIASRTPYAESVQLQFPDHVTLVGSIEKPLDTIDILKLQEVQKALSGKETGNTYLLVFKNTTQIESLAKENNWNLLNPSAELAEKIENKITQVEWLGELSSYLPSCEIKEVKNITSQEKFVPFILQWAHSHSGDGTIIVSSNAELAEFKNKFPSRLARISSFINGPSFTVNIAVEKNAGTIYLGNINYQITGMLPFTDNPCSTVGNDWSLPRTILTEEKHTEMEKISKQIAQKMLDSGWRGLFGLDFIYDENRDEIRLIEINARQTAGVTFESQLELENRRAGLDGITVFEAHLVSLLQPFFDVTKEISPTTNKIIEINDGAQILQRVTALLMKSAKLPDIALLRAVGFACIQYTNSKLNSHILRIQSSQGVMETHNKFNSRGKQILDLIQK